MQPLISMSDDSQSLPIMRGTVQRRLFKNGYGVSIVAEKDGVTYELGVLRHVDGRYARLTYDSGVLDDVVRYVTAEGIEDLTERVKQLPSVISG